MELSPDAHEILVMAREMVVESLPERAKEAVVSKDLHLHAWDAGWFQLKQVIKRALPKKHSLFIEKFQAFERRIEEGCYEFGFLPKSIVDEPTAISESTTPHPRTSQRAEEQPHQRTQASKAEEEPSRSATESFAHFKFGGYTHEPPPLKTEVSSQPFRQNPRHQQSHSSPFSESSSPHNFMQSSPLDFFRPQLAPFNPADSAISNHIPTFLPAHTPLSTSSQPPPATNQPLLPTPAFSHRYVEAPTSESALHLPSYLPPLSPTSEQLLASRQVSDHRDSTTGKRRKKHQTADK